MCFCDQTHGRTNQLPIKIMTGPWGDLPLEIQDLSGQIDLPITLETSHNLFNIAQADKRGFIST